jgi:hypothetical protein
VNKTGSFLNRCWCGSQGDDSVLDHAATLLVDSSSFNERDEQQLDTTKPTSPLRPKTLPIEKEDYWQREEDFQEQKDSTERDDSSCQRITPPMNNHCTSFGTDTTATMRTISYVDECPDEENDDDDSATTPTEIVSHGKHFRPVHPARTNVNRKRKEPYQCLLRMRPSNYLGVDLGQYSVRYPAEKDV